MELFLLIGAACVAALAIAGVGRVFWRGVKSVVHIADAVGPEGIPKQLSELRTQVTKDHKALSDKIDIVDEKVDTVAAQLSYGRDRVE